MIFIERNDPNQISNLIDFSSRDYKIVSNFSSTYSDNSDNGNNEKSFDLYRQDDNNSLSESQISEYAVQKSFTDNNEKICSRDESQSSMYNLNFIKVENNNKDNLDFLNLNSENQNNEDMKIFGIKNNEFENKNIFNYDKLYSRKTLLMNEFDKYKEEEVNDNSKYTLNKILEANKSDNEDLNNTNNKEAKNNLRNKFFMNNSNNEESNSNLDIQNKKFSENTTKFEAKGIIKQAPIPKIHNKGLKINKVNLDFNRDISIDNLNNAKTLKEDHSPSCLDLIGKFIIILLLIIISQAICSSKDNE